MRFSLRTVVGVFVLAFCCSLGVVAQAAEKGASYQAAIESITADGLGQYVGQLADESMEGREAGTRGGLAASKYVAEQFTRLNLQPAGVDGKFFQPFVPNFRNILAVIHGSDPELRDQVIVVGAHYDHVGYGRHGLSLGPTGYIHPGADDNASGMSAMLKIAEAFTLLAEPPKRSIVFAAWDAEEKGMLGSKYWLAHPTVPLEHIVAAMNLDMIGRLRDERVFVYGSRTGSGWRRLLSQQNDSLGLHLDFCWTLKPNADHFAFFDRGIPVVMMNTGLHDNYHRPSDTADRVDNAGVMRVARLAFGVAYELAQRPAPAPPFRPTARHETPETERSILARASKPSDRLGVGWVDDPKATQGARLSWIAPGSPAEQAGLRVGDCILRFADRQILSDDDFYAAVSAAESPATLVIKRTGEDKPLEVTVELSGAPLRWGISWRVDDAEPETIILTHVAPGSPAAVAGLQPGDRIYQVAGRDFADEAAFAQRVKTSAETMPLLVERDGRLRVIVLQRFGSHVLKRAA